MGSRYRILKILSVMIGGLLLATFYLMGFSVPVRDYPVTGFVSLLFGVLLFFGGLIAMILGDND